MMKTLRWMPERTCTHTHTHTCIHMQTHIYPSLHTCCEANYNIELRLKETSVVEPNNKHFILGNAVHFKKHWFWRQHSVDTLCETTQRKDTKAQQKNQKAQTHSHRLKVCCLPNAFSRFCLTSLPWGANYNQSDLSHYTSNNNHRTRLRISISHCRDADSTNKQLLFLSIFLCDLATVSPQWNVMWNTRFTPVLSRGINWRAVEQLEMSDRTSVSPNNSIEIHPHRHRHRNTHTHTHLSYSI